MKSYNGIKEVVIKLPTNRRMPRKLKKALKKFSMGHKVNGYNFAPMVPCSLSA